ncbi:SWIM-type domain-containing protein [Trichonephila clavipes]|nr:SWIM-type domain-containing protein [Trichonephila clavipes]
MLNVSIIPPCDEEFITSLRNIMRHLNPVATSTHGHSAHFVHPALSSCTHVFLRIDKVSPPLTQPYTDHMKAPKINTALKDITTSPKTVSEGQKQFSSSSKCLPSTTSTRTRSGRQSLGDTPVVNPPNGDRLIMIVCHLRVATQKMSQEECTTVKVHEDHLWAVLLVTPLMKRNHHLFSSKEIIFIDSTSSCEASSSTITILLSATKIGALPLAVMIHVSQSIQNYINAFQLLKMNFPQCFGGQDYPEVFE